VHEIAIMYEMADAQQIRHPKRFACHSKREHNSNNNKIGTHSNLSWTI
jgi:hypothetical protein